MKQTKSLFFFLTLLSYGVALAQFFPKEKDVTAFGGFFNFHYHQEQGKIFLEVPQQRLAQEFLYVHALRTGLGSNDIGLDRGQLGGGQVVKFLKAGSKLLLVAPNLNYRANTENPLEGISVQEAFGTHVLFGFGISQTIDGVYLIDITEFLLQDTHGVAQTLKDKNQGTYKLDQSKSAIWMERTKAFVQNVEFEALLTFTGNPTGGALKSVNDRDQLSTIQHHSFVALPDDGYAPRVFDPRCGSFPMTYYDYGTSIDQPLKQQYITRHRLEKAFPDLPKSKAKEPIIYYLDPATPEPVRSALLEGAQWWNQAFVTLGYIDAFQVKMLPEDADPLDVRYNVIQWVHRATRGWSYGSSITDPRTGEIIKGHVSLGSLRVRQDFLLAQGLTNRPYANEAEGVQALTDLALARLRQLSAHEVGHTLGFAHNFAASTLNDASVMDYPHPALSLKNNTIDLSQAYKTGIGRWDKVAVAYSYSDIPEGELPNTYLGQLLDSAFSNGMTFITDADARAPSGSHALAHLWDNGATAANALTSILAVRQRALDQFSVDQIPKGRPYSELEDVFVPMYLLHRYQTEAAVKLIGGTLYDYQVKGGVSSGLRIVPKNDQLTALNAVLVTLSPTTLEISSQLQKLFPPRAFGFARTRESFKSNLGLNFDPISAAVTASEMTLGLLMMPERLNRLYLQEIMDPQELGLKQALSIIENALGQMDKQPSYHQSVQAVVFDQYLQFVMAAMVSKKTMSTVKALLGYHLRGIQKSLKKGKTVDDRYWLSVMAYFEAHPDKFEPVIVPKIPDGSPIGQNFCTTSAW